MMLYVSFFFCVTICIYGYIKIFGIKSVFSWRKQYIELVYLIPSAVIQVPDNTDDCRNDVTPINTSSKRYMLRGRAWSPPSEQETINLTESKYEYCGKCYKFQ